MAGTALAACLLLGLTPALRASRGSPGDVLKAGARGVAGDHESLTLRRALVVAQVAVSLVLVVGALLFARSFRNLLAEPLGFEPRGVLVVDADLPPPPPALAKRALAFKREVIAALRAMPGVDAAAETGFVPLSGNNSSNAVWLDGASRERGSHSLLQSRLAEATSTRSACACSPDATSATATPRRRRSSPSSTRRSRARSSPGGAPWAAASGSRHAVGARAAGRDRRAGRRRQVPPVARRAKAGRLHSRQRSAHHHAAAGQFLVRTAAGAQVVHANAEGSARARSA